MEIRIRYMNEKFLVLAEDNGTCVEFAEGIEIDSLFKELGKKLKKRSQLTGNIKGCRK